MIMKKPLLLILYFSILFQMSAHSQVSFQAYGGLATFQMDGLKDLNALVEESVPFDISNVDNFDPGFYFGASVKTALFSNLMVGLSYQYNTTGSRIGLKDYSGYYNFDQIVNGHLLGIEPGVIMEETSKYRLVFSVMSGALFTSIKTEEVLSVSGQKEEDQEYMSAFSIPVYPSINLSIPVNDFISGYFSAGYMVDTGGKVHLKDNRDAVLNIDGYPVKTGWTGFRISAGLQLNLGRR
jgi:hypothetical protein